MNQQNGFIRNNRIPMGRNRVYGNEIQTGSLNIHCKPDYGKCPCDIPINSYEYGLKENCLSFVAEVVIPEGFILVGEQSNIGISLDTTGLSVLGMTQNCQCCDTVLCNTNRNAILLNGLLTYNVVLEGFSAACPLESANVTPGTMFNGTGTVYIDKLLETSYRDVDLRNPEYTIIPEKCEEYITAFDGRSIYANRDSVEYNCLLRNPDVKKTVKLPYRLIIQGIGMADVNPMNNQ